MANSCHFKKNQAVHLALFASVIIMLGGILLVITLAGISEPGPEGWRAESPREEIRPAMTYKATGGRSDKDCLVIQSDQREGLHGIWRKMYRVNGGGYYRFEAWRKAEQVKSPRRSVLAEIIWQDHRGNKVPRDEPSQTTFMPGTIPTAEPEYPPDLQRDTQGWTQIAGIYRVPKNAEQAVIRLHLRWAPLGKVVFSDISLEPCDPPPSRKVRIAAVHFFPQGGKTAAENCRMFAPMLDEAGRQRADLVVLPESLTYAGREPKVTPFDAAEPIPGPSTDYFGIFSKKHNYYIVAGLTERSGHLVYNTAALIGPDGTVVGKYRKVTLPRSEWDEGVAPGDEYPVFSTRFGKVGMMVCYDGYFPEVARQLSIRGAEIIAWPVWGCIPELARARAIENHVYLASSTYTENWMISGVFDHSGKVLAQTDQPGTMAVAEVDLAQTTYWPIMGDLKAEIERHRPSWRQEQER